MRPATPGGQRADAITILLVDDHALVREGLREILDAQEDMRVIGEAGDSATAVAAAARERPDIVLLDVEIPGEDVTSTIGQIRARSPASSVVILSMYEGPQLLQSVLGAGASGYLLKSIHWEQLVAAIRTLHADRTRVLLDVSQESLAYVRGPAPGLLSAREQEVLQLTAEALSNRQIATRLSLTEATVKRHMRNIFVKLGAVSRLDAVNKALSASLIRPTTQSAGMHQDDDT
jgi:DNA-binding NarL/FixJ family response regulator